MPQRNELYSHLKQPSSLFSLVSPSLSLRFPQGFKSRRLGFQDVDLYVEQRMWPHKPSGEKGAP